MTNPSSDLHMTYLGWSGFRLSWSGGPQVVVDTPDVAGLDRERETWLLLSHGHSEHVAGTLKYLADTTRVAPVTVLASPPVCRYLKCRYSRTDDRFIPCSPGDVKTLSDLRIDVFGWQHMPLLPSGLRPALRYLFHLVRHLDFTLKILRDDLKVMRVGPMLGFRLVPKKGSRLLLYSEGLHLHTNKIEAKKNGSTFRCRCSPVCCQARGCSCYPGIGLCDWKFCCCSLRGTSILEKRVRSAYR